MKRYLIGTAASAAVLVAAGCAGQQVRALEPKLELRSAAQQLGDAQQAGFTIKLAGSADDLLAGLELQAATSDAKSTDDDELPDRATLSKLLNSSFTVAYDKGGAGAEDDRSSLAATIDGVTGTEIRIAGGRMYAKAPLAELSAKLGAGEDVSALRKEAGPLDPLFDGKWISIDTKEATALTGAYATGAAPATDDLDSARALKEFQTSATNLLEGAQIVRDSADEHHLVVTSSTATAYAEVQRMVTALDGKDATGLSEDLGKAPADRPIVLDLWLADGKLTAAEVDVLQFIDGAAGRAAVRIEVTTGTAIEIPAGATAIDLGDLGAAGA